MSDKSYTPILHSLKKNDIVEVTGGYFPDFTGEVVEVDTEAERVVVWFEHVTTTEFSDFHVEYYGEGINYLHCPMSTARPKLEEVFRLLNDAAAIMEDTGGVESNMLDEVADLIMQAAIKLKAFGN